MKIVFVNGGSNGSSWSLMYSLALNQNLKGHSVFLCTPNNKPSDCLLPYFRFGSSLSRKYNKIITRLDGSDGFRNHKDTKQLINFILKVKPDIVHLHTLHGYCIDVSLLLRALKENGIKIVITLHDCWWFTGRCSHYFFNKCEKWKINCHNCKFRNVYPSSIFDRCSSYFKLKKDLLSNDNNITITAVSEWLKDEASLSPIFKGTKVVCINNGVDDGIFNIKTDEKVRNERNVLCIAHPWSNEKGLDMLEQLIDRNPKYHFVVVGMIPDYLTKRPNIEHINYISNKSDLVSLYNKSSVLLNLSKQETFSLINIEAQMCGLKVISYSSTGMKETVDITNSILVDDYSIESFEKALGIAFENIGNKDDLRTFALKFSLNKMNDNFSKLYDDIINTNEK